MPVVLIFAATAAILGGVLVAALGRGGEMAAFPGDFPPLGRSDLRPAEVFALRPPMSLWGYHAGASEEAWRLIARTLAARDAEISALRSELAELRAGQSPDRTGAVPSGD